MGGRMLGRGAGCVRWLGVFLGVMVAAGGAGEDLAGRLRTKLGEAKFGGAEWGVEVVSLDTGRTVFEEGGGRRMVPGSNAKLFMAALALHELGPDFRIRTSLYGAGKPDGAGVLAGDLILFGRGDPTIMGRDGDGDPLGDLAQQLWDRGVRRVAGDLVGDDSFFDLPGYGAGWEAEDLGFAFGAVPSALSIHGNVVDLRIYPGAAGGPCVVVPEPGLGAVRLENLTTTGGGTAGVRSFRPMGAGAITVTGSLPLGAAPAQARVPVQDPALLFAQLLRRALLRRGIQVGGTARSVHAYQRPAPLEPDRLTELAHLESPRLEDMLRSTLKASLNLDAELLYLQAGAARPGPGPNTEGRSAEALRDFLRASGLNPAEVLLEEGSGLSRKDLVTPGAVVGLLALMARSPGAGAFLDALPVAGVDGTLRDRMAGTSAQGRVRAKTGTLRYTHTLSGYATTAAGERLAFSFLLNDYQREPKAPPASAELDALAILLTEP